MTDIVILGASRGPGRILYERLVERGTSVTGIARSSGGVDVSATGTFIECDAENSQELSTKIPAGATLIHCTRPEFLTRLLNEEPDLKRIVALGSTRVYTRFPDDKCSRVAGMAHAIWMQDIPATILHPTMIYGAPGFNNIERVFNIAHRSPWIPLPDRGAALIQPVHVVDVSKSIEACLADDATLGKTIIVAGRDALTYQAFVELCIEVSGASCRVVHMPYLLVSALGLLTHLLPGVPTISQDEIRRLLENKNHDISEMRSLLGIEPMSIEEGLRSIA